MSVGVDVKDSLNANAGDTRLIQDFYFGDQNISSSPAWLTHQRGIDPVFVYVGVAVAVFVGVMLLKKGRK